MATPMDLSLPQLWKKLSDVVPDWMMFGIQLKVPIDKLRVIEKRPSCSLQEKFVYMLDEWSKGDNYTWDSVYNALNAIGNKRLAHKIREKHGTGKVTLELSEVERELEECVPAWLNFGIMLGVPKLQLDMIDNKDPFSKNLLDTLEYWMNNCSDKTWETIVEALRNINYNRMAAAIEREYITRT